MDLDHERIPVLDKFILMVILASCLNLTACAARDPVYWTATDRALLLKKEKQEETDHYGNTPLLWAVEEGQKDIVEFLIRENIDINIRHSVTGSTAVILAAKEEHLDILNMLIKSGADIEARDNSGLSALDWAARRANREIVLALKRSTSHETFPSTGNALVYAVYSNDPDTIKLLIEEGALIDAPDMHADTPFIAAVKMKNVETARLLIELGANFRTLDGRGQTPLMLAAQAGSVDVASLLIAQGAEVNEQNMPGYSPLMSAAANNQAAMVDFLLLQGSDPDLRDNNGLSATYFAAENRNVEIEVNLLKAGANICGQALSVLDDNPYATAFMYKVAGDYFLGHGIKKDATDCYSLAQASFVKLSEKYASQASRESTKELFKISGEALVVVAAMAAEQHHVQAQSSYNAQLYSLANSNSGQEYYQTLATSLPIYEQHEQSASDARIASYDAWLFRDRPANADKEEYLRLSEEADENAEQIGRVLQCIEKSPVSNIKACHGI